MNDLNLSSKIYAHRGFWILKEEQNTMEAFCSAQVNQFAVETDFRDHCGQVVVSHDPVESKRGLITLSAYLDLGIKTAVNIKSDGLSDFFDESREVLEAHGSWVFDGSIPEMLRYKDKGIKHALRISELEKEVPWTPQVLWVDCLISDWYINDRSLFDKFPNTEIVFVSPELHGRDFENVWNYFEELVHDGISNVSLCTDYPNQVLERVGNEV
jgi:glycerophosphoryl diester phosphodiesterase